MPGEKEKRDRRKKREERSIEVPGMKLLVALSATDDRVSLRVSISTVILVVEHLNETSRSFLSPLSFRAGLFLFSIFSCLLFFSLLLFFAKPRLSFEWRAIYQRIRRVD